MDFWLLIFFAVLIVVLAFIHANKEINSNTKRLELRLRGQRNFSPSKKLYGCNGLSGIAIDEANKKICLLSLDKKIASARVFSYKDLISTELFQDGSSITRTSRSSQAGSALLGGLLLGGVGVIVGGLSGKKKTTEKVNHVALRLVVNDTKKPLHDVCFLNIEVKKDSAIYKSAIQNARFWNGLMDVLIKDADNDDVLLPNDESGSSNIEPIIPQPITSLNTLSIADELKKLSNLHQDGILTDEEFQSQKAKLLQLT